VGRDGEVVKLICCFGKPEFLCKRGWTGKSADDPTGKSPRVWGAHLTAADAPSQAQIGMVWHVDYIDDIIDGNTRDI
jgi:hypothetical protein